MLPYKFSDLLVYSFGFYTISKKKFPKKKFFQNFQKIELWSPIKGSRVIFEQKHFGIFPYYNPRAIQKKKKGEIFTIGFFLTDSSS